MDIAPVCDFIPSQFWLNAVGILEHVYTHIPPRTINTIENHYCLNCEKDWRRRWWRRRQKARCLLCKCRSIEAQMFDISAHVLSLPALIGLKCSNQIQFDDVCNLLLCWRDMCFMRPMRREWDERRKNPIEAIYPPLPNVRLNAFSYIQTISSCTHTMANIRW